MARCPCPPGRDSASPTTGLHRPSPPRSARVRLDAITLSWFAASRNLPVGSIPNCAASCPGSARGRRAPACRAVTAARTSRPSRPVALRDPALPHLVADRRVDGIPVIRVQPAGKGPVHIARARRANPARATSRGRTAGLRSRTWDWRHRSRRTPPRRARRSASHPCPAGCSTGTPATTRLCARQTLNDCPLRTSPCRRTGVEQRDLAGTCVRK